MTIGDLLAGEWTWLELARDLAPTVVIAATAYGAGYSRGRLVELRLQLAPPSQAPPEKEKA